MILVIHIKKISFQIKHDRLILNLDLEFCIMSQFKGEKTEITILISMFESKRRLDNIGRIGGQKLCISWEYKTVIPLFSWGLGSNTRREETNIRE
jgi:hypothetical protein